MKTKHFDTAKITYLSLFTALVAVFQYLGGFIKLGMFSVSCLAQIPIVLGAALCGVWAGGWLGLVFGLVVFITGDAATFLAIDVAGTIVTVLVKGIAAGLCAGLAYKLFEKFNKYAAVFAAGILCPIVNTGIFLIGCRLFFFEAVSAWAGDNGMPVGKYMILGLVGLNFILELSFNIVLAPTVVRLLNVKKKKR
jgi:uncharacterized membrane protein